MNEEKESSYKMFDDSYVEALRNDAQQQMVEGDICGNDNPREKIDHYKAAETALRLADTLQERITKEEPKKGFIGWLTRKHPVSIADVVIGVVGPVLVLIGTKYTADKRVEEARINVEAERVKADSAERIERIRCESRERQLERLCRASDEEVIPDTLSLKVLNDNNR